MLQCKQGQMHKALYRNRTSKSFSSRRPMKPHSLFFFGWVVLVAVDEWLVVGAASAIAGGSGGGGSVFFGCHFCCSCHCSSYFSDCTFWMFSFLVFPLLFCILAGVSSFSPLVLAGRARQ